MDACRRRVRNRRAGDGHQPPGRICQGSGAAPGGQAVAIDGKAQRGRLRFQEGGCPIHALTAFCGEFGVVLAEEPIKAGQGTEQSEAELTVAPARIARLDWHGRVLTADALLCQRRICQQVLHAGGDDVLVVKENHPTRYDDRRLLFDPPSPALPRSSRRETRTLERGHGRDQARHDGIPSLPPSSADAAQLLRIRRGHWSNEHQRHYPKDVKDVTMNEDRSLVPAGQEPTVLAMLGDSALSLLRLSGCQTIASRLRALADDPSTAVALVAKPISARA